MAVLSIVIVQSQSTPQVLTQPAHPCREQAQFIIKQSVLRKFISCMTRETEINFPVDTEFTAEKLYKKDGSIILVVSEDLRRVRCPYRYSSWYFNGKTLEFIKKLEHNVLC